MKVKDMKQAVKLLENEWDLGEKESGASRHLCAWIYLMELLEETEEFIYHRENGRLLGFAGYSNKSSKKTIKRKIYTFVKNMLYKSKSIKDINALHAYENNYEYMPDNLKERYDGEVSMLILDSRLRGKGIGKKLLSELFQLAKRNNVNNLYILTDESCNYHIYESLGCKRVYETIIENKEYGKLGNISKEKAFIYEKIM